MGWILGWAVPAAWFEAQVREALPGAEHVLLPAGPTALADLAAAGSFDWVVGYSLGASLLLTDPVGAARALASGGRVALLAPIFSLVEEDGWGGRVRRSQLQLMIRRLRRDPAATLADFYARAGLDLAAASAVGQSPEALLWGLHWLEREKSAPPLPAGWRAWVGENDALLTAGRLREVAPSVTMVAGANHHPGPLLRAFAAEMARLAVPAAAHSFDRAAGSYLAHARVQSAMAEWLAEWIPPGRTGRALEIGAGPGVFTSHLLPWPGTLTASDASAAMCAAGRAHFPEIPWEVMAAEAPAPGPWDWIFSSSMLQWAADPEAVFAAWRARLAAGGQVLAGLFVAGTLAEWNALAEDTAPLTWRSAAAWRQHLETAGFRLVREEQVERSFFHPSARDFLRSLHRVGAAPKRRTSLARLRSLLRDYEARHPAPEGGVVATWAFYRFEARLA